MCFLLEIGASGDLVPEPQTLDLLIEVPVSSRAHAKVKGRVWGEGQDSGVSQISPDSRRWGDLRFVLVTSGDGVSHPVLFPCLEILREPRTWDEPRSGHRVSAVLVRRARAAGSFQTLPS